MVGMSAQMVASSVMGAHMRPDAEPDCRQRGNECLCLSGPDCGFGPGGK